MSIKATRNDPEHLPCAIILDHHPADSRTDIAEDQEKIQTLTSRMGTGGGNVPMILEPIVLQSNQNQATITQTGKCPTLVASMGMGGGYVPMIVELPEPKTYTIDMGGGKSSVCTYEEKAPTLACTHYGEPAVAYELKGGNDEK